jgi:hypothetical protein
MSPEDLPEGGINFRGETIDVIQLSDRVYNVAFPA